MSIRILCAIALTASLLLIAGCDRSQANDYPDRSDDTTRRVDDINRYARDQKDAIDAEADRLSTKMDFDERQIRERYKAQRQEFVNESNQEATERNATIRSLQIQAKHDKDVIDAEMAEELKTSAPDKAAEIRADAASEKSDIERETNRKLAELESVAERERATITQQKLDIDRDESKEISALEQERSKVRNQTNEKKLKVDKWTTEELSKVANDSKSANR